MDPEVAGSKPVTHPIPSSRNSLISYTLSLVHPRRVPDWLRGGCGMDPRTGPINIASYTVPVEVYDGNRKIGIIDRRGYLSWEREPGDTTISTKPGTSLEVGSIALALQQGTVSYMLEQTAPAGPFSFSSLRTTLTLVDNMTGQDELAKAKPSAIKD